MQTNNMILSQSDLRVLENAVLKYQKIVTFDDLVGLFGKTETREVIRKKVALLVQKGWLIRLKKGLYVVITDISTLGANDLSEYVVAGSLHRNSYISFENALQYRGFFDQMLQTVASVTATYARSYTVGKTKYAFSRIKKELYFGFHEETINSYTVNIAEAEKAILDILYFRNSIYGISLVLEKLREYKHRLDFKKLKDYAQRYNLSMVRRVGFLLDQVEIDTSDLFSQVKGKKNSYNKLTQGSTAFNAKWRLYYDHQALI